MSPSRAKLSQLSEKLSRLSVDEDKALKRETFEAKLKTLDEKVTKTTQTDEQKFKVGVVE